MSDEARYGGFKVRVDCSACGHPVPVNGPLERAHCDSCQQEFALPSEMWRVLLEQFDDDYASMTFGASSSATRGFADLQAHFTVRCVMPECGQCHKPLAVDQATNDGATPIICSGCGARNSRDLSPAWLRSIVPTARCCFGADTKSSSGLAQPLEMARALRAVAMACPNCGASLQLEAAEKRIIACGFCRTDIFLPDELWRRLHPARIAREWYVRFEGETPTQVAKHQAAVAHVESALETVRRSIALNERRPRGFAANLPGALVTWFFIGLVGWLIAGAPISMIAFHALGFSPAGAVLCPLQCENCSGPGRAFAWNFEGSWEEKKGRMGFALVCNNPEIDPAQLTVSRIWEPSTNERLQPYMVDGILTFFVEGLMVAAALGLVVGARKAAGTRRPLETEHARLLGELESLEAKRKRLTGTHEPRRYSQPLG